MTCGPTVAIVQARMGSTRLPGKVLLPIAGQTMLSHVVHRAQAAKRVDQVVVATSSTAADDRIARHCEPLGVDCFRGSEDDVLDRFHRAALAHHAAVVVRITADCPLIDPQVIDQTIATFHRDRPDYASNVLERTWPRGLDTEVISCDALFRAAREATEDYHRSHVTPYIYEHPELFRLASVRGPEELAEWRWTVDTAEDLALVRAVHARLRPEQTLSWQTIRRLVDGDASLRELNQHVAQKDLHEG